MEGVRLPPSLGCSLPPPSSGPRASASRLPPPSLSAPPLLLPPSLPAPPFPLSSSPFPLSSSPPLLHLPAWGGGSAPAEGPRGSRGSGAPPAGRAGAADGLVARCAAGGRENSRGSPLARWRAATRPGRISYAFWRRSASPASTKTRWDKSLVARPGSGPSSQGQDLRLSGAILSWDACRNRQGVDSPPPARRLLLMNCCGGEELGFAPPGARATYTREARSTGR